MHVVRTVIKAESIISHFRVLPSARV